MDSNFLVLGGGGAGGQLGAPEHFEFCQYRGKPSKGAHLSEVIKNNPSTRERSDRAGGRGVSPSHGI